MIGREQREPIILRVHFYEPMKTWYPGGCNQEKERHTHRESQSKGLNSNSWYISKGDVDNRLLYTHTRTHTYIYNGDSHRCRDIVIYHIFRLSPHGVDELASLRLWLSLLTNSLETRPNPFCEIAVAFVCVNDRYKVSRVPATTRLVRHLIH